MSLRPGGFLDVIVDFGETAAVGVAGLVIDDGEARAGAFGHGIQAVVAVGPVGSVPRSTATRSSTWNSRPGSASNRSR